MPETTETVETVAVETVENQVAPETQSETTTPETAKDDFIPKSRFTQVYAKAKQLERENAALLARFGTGNDGRPPAPATEEKAPDPQDPKYAANEAQYYADVADFSGRRAFKSEQIKAEQQAQQQKFASRQQAASQNYLQKVAQEVVKDPNLEHELEELATIQFHPHTALLLEESEQAGLLAKHLAKNIGEAYRLRELSLTDPLKAAVEVGILTMKLQGTNQPSKVVRTRAPDPITPVKGGGGTQKDYKPGDGPDAFISAFLRSPD